jgi:hypothetical protein
MLLAIRLASSIVSIGLYRHRLGFRGHRSKRGIGRSHPSPYSLRVVLNAPRRGEAGALFGHDALAYRFTLAL